MRAGHVDKEDMPMAGRGVARVPTADATGTVVQIPVTRLLADELTRGEGPVRKRAAGRLRELADVDRAVYSAVATTATPSLDEPLRRLSNAANNSRLWLTIAAGLAVAGGGAGSPGRGAGGTGYRRHVRAGEPRGQVHLVPAAAGPGRRWSLAPADGTDAGLHIIPVRSRGVGVRLRLGHRQGPAPARPRAALPSSRSGLFSGAQRSALPGRRGGRFADRRGHRAGCGRPDGPAIAGPRAFTIRSQRAR